MSSKTLILKTWAIASCFSMGLLLANTANAQTSDTKTTTTLNEEADDDDGESTETIKVKRRVSSVSKGYRVQIYSGPDREAAKATKITFMKRFPSIRSYISYEVPYYKIKVGDFKSRKEAMEFYRHLSKTYTTMVVPSLINNRIPPKVVPPPAPINKPTNTTTDTVK